MAGPLDAGRPVARVSIAGLSHVPVDARVRELLPTPVRPAGGLGCGYQDVLVSCRSEPGREFGGALDHRQSDDVTFHGALRAGTPAQHRCLEGPHTRAYEVDVCRTPTPPLPGSVLLDPSGDAPRGVVRNEPVTGGLELRRAGQTGTDRVHEHLRKLVGPGAVHPHGPNAEEYRVVRGEGLGTGGGREQRYGQRECQAEAETRGGDGGCLRGVQCSPLGRVTAVVECPRKL